MINFNKLKKDIQYTPDEVYALVSKAISCDNYRISRVSKNPIPINRGEELISNISKIGHSCEYKDYPEKLKHIIADHDRRASRWAMRTPKFFNGIFPEKIVTTSNIVYKISLEDLPMFLDYDSYEFLIQWRFEIKK